MRNNNVTRSICIGGVVGALYAVLTLALPILSYGPVQVRFAEALTVLPFFLPETVPGLAIGCFAANLIGSPYALDWVIGTSATLIAAVWTSRLKNRRLAPLPAVVCNTLIVGGEIAWIETGFTEAFVPAWIYNGATVALGEILACYILGTFLIRTLPGIGLFRQLVPEKNAGKLG